jgi:hypothetical protein
MHYLNTDIHLSDLTLSLREIASLHVVLQRHAEMRNSKLCGQTLEALIISSVINLYLHSVVTPLRNSKCIHAVRACPGLNLHWAILKPNI